MKDIIVRAVTKSGSMRAFVAQTTVLCEKARSIHDTWPVVTAALGRVLTGAAMMGMTMKGEKDTISLQIKGDGPVGGIVAVANMEAQVRGYVHENAVELPLSSSGKLDVGTAVGNGYLTVIRDMGLKEPYIGRVEIQTGEIAEDLTYYFASSEQVPSAVALGVLVNTDWSVKAAGGYIIQLMPGAEEEEIARLSENISKLKPISTMVDEGLTCEEILEQVLCGMEFEVVQKVEPAYQCNCDRERICGVLLSIGKEDLSEIARSEDKTEIVCQFCSEKYYFSSEEIKALAGLDEEESKKM